MNSLKNSPHYQNALHELEYDFGTFYLFNNFIVSEINEGIIISWENQAKKITEEILGLYDSNGEDLIYISNRIHDYSIVPSDWIKFYRNNYRLKGYGMINYSKNGHINSLLEKFFVKSKTRKFNSLNNAIEWANESSKSIVGVLA